MAVFSQFLPDEKLDEQTEKRFAARDAAKDKRKLLRRKDENSRADFSVRL